MHQPLGERRIKSALATPNINPFVSFVSEDLGLMTIVNLYKYL